MFVVIRPKPGNSAWPPTLIHNPTSAIRNSPARHLDSFAAIATIKRVKAFSQRRRAVAIKPPELLDRIPSVSELLEKPQIRALAERWNRSTVANGIRSFLDELRSDLQRRTADANLPSVRELAERAARYVVSWQQHEMRIAINATGRIWGPPWTSPPLADGAVEHAFVTGREFTFTHNSADSNSPPVEALLTRLSGAQAAALVHSYTGAVWLSIAALAADRELLVARAEVGDIGDLPKLADAAKVVLKEVGTTNSALAADYEEAASERTAAVLKLNPDTYYVIGQTATAELDELVALARDRELVSIDALGTAPLAEPPQAVCWPRRSAHASIAAGTDLVILRGDGLVGGPPCGILLGRKEVITRITENPLFAAWRLDAPRSAALAATLECYGNPAGGHRIDSGVALPHGIGRQSSQPR